MGASTLIVPKRACRSNVETFAGLNCSKGPRGDMTFIERGYECSISSEPKSKGDSYLKPGSLAFEKPAYITRYK